MIEFVNGMSDIINDNADVLEETYNQVQDMKASITEFGNAFVRGDELEKRLNDQQTQLLKTINRDLQLMGENLESVKQPKKKGIPCGMMK